MYGSNYYVPWSLHAKFSWDELLLSISWDLLTVGCNKSDIMTMELMYKWYDDFNMLYKSPCNTSCRLDYSLIWNLSIFVYPWYLTRQFWLVSVFLAFWKLYNLKCHYESFFRILTHPYTHPNSHTDNLLILYHVWTSSFVQDLPGTNCYFFPQIIPNSPKSLHISS